MAVYLCDRLMTCPARTPPLAQSQPGLAPPSPRPLTDKQYRSLDGLIVFSHPLFPSVFISQPIDKLDLSSCQLKYL